MTSEQLGLRCDVCTQWTHVECICRSENAPGITDKIYMRLEDKKFAFHCLRCKSSEEPSFLQSLYDCHIITEEEIEPLDWKEHVVIPEVSLESDEALGTGDASTAIKQTAVASGSREVFAGVELRPSAAFVQNPAPAPDFSQMINFLMLKMQTEDADRKADEKKREEAERKREEDQKKRDDDRAQQMQHSQNTMMLQIQEAQRIRDEKRDEQREKDRRADEKRRDEDRKAEKESQNTLILQMQADRKEEKGAEMK